MTPGEVRRLYFIIRTFLSYGLDELIPRMRLTLPLRLWRYSLFWMPNRHKDKLLGERLRLALQELGPVWIKFGQMLSTRRDLFPPQSPISSLCSRIKSRHSMVDWRKPRLKRRWGGYQSKPGLTTLISSL